MKHLLDTGMIIQMNKDDYYYVIAGVVYKGQEYADIVKYPKNIEDYYHEDRLERQVVKVVKIGEQINVDPIDDKKIQERVRKVGDSKINPVKKVTRN